MHMTGDSRSVSSALALEIVHPGVMQPEDQAWRSLLFGAFPQGLSLVTAQKFGEILPLARIVDFSKVSPICRRKSHAHRRVRPPFGDGLPLTMCNKTLLSELSTLMN